MRGNGEQGLDRDMARVLRFLTQGPVTIRAAMVQGVILLDGGDRGMISTTQGVLCLLAKERLVQRKGDCLSIVNRHGSPGKRAAGKRGIEKAGVEKTGIGKIEARECTGALHDKEEPGLIVLAESPLAALATRRHRGGRPYLVPHEVRAGERLRMDYTRGQIMPSLGIDWDRLGMPRQDIGNNHGRQDLSDSASRARDRVNAALKAVGPELSGVLVDVCCFLKGVEQVEAEHQLPARSAKVLLKAGLGMLSRHYEPSRGHKSQVLHWGADGYRPSIR